jgi:hypothetical protein
MKKIGTYAFGITQNVVLGTPSNIRTESSPQKSFKTISKILTNAPCRGFASIGSIGMVKCNRKYIADDGFLHGDQFDCLLFSYEVALQDIGMNKVVVMKGQPCKVIGKYTGLVPEGYIRGQSYLFAVNILGQI